LDAVGGDGAMARAGKARLRRRRRRRYCRAWTFFPRRRFLDYSRIVRRSAIIGEYRGRGNIGVRGSEKVAIAEGVGSWDQGIISSSQFFFSSALPLYSFHLRTNAGKPKEPILDGKGTIGGARN